MPDAARDADQSDDLADDEWEEEEDGYELGEDARRVQAAAGLADTDPDRGIPALLTLIADTDLGTVDNLEYRSDALDHLLRRGGSAATAAWWVINTSNPWREMQRVYLELGQYHGPPEANPTDEERQQDHVAALRHLVAASDLQDDLRWPAIAELIDKEGRKGYEAVKSLAPDINIASSATGVYDVDDDQVYSLARWVAADQDQPAEVRVAAAKWLLEEEAWCAEDAAADALRGIPVGTAVRRRLLLELLKIENVHLEITDPASFELQQRQDRADNFPGAIRLAMEEASRSCWVGPLGALLQSWVDAALGDHQWEERWPSAYQAYDVAVEPLLSIAFHHQELRKRLAADLISASSDTDWRPLLVRRVDPRHKQASLLRATAEHGRFAFKATPECQFALCRTTDDSSDPPAWELTVFQNGTTSALSFAGRLLVQGEQTFIHFPDELNAHPNWSAQLVAGLSAIARAELLG
ncbi:hypothetical protein [Streptomyces sp. NPDC058545]|uniref:hypothetical protein n=1 Tax=Streptomyces sp. NPDC058545 TaxID=3346544 RepID=UPI00364685EA